MKIKKLKIKAKIKGKLWRGLNKVLNILKTQCRKRSKRIKQMRLKIILREFPGGLVVSTWCFHCWGHGLIPDQRTKIPQAA